MYVRGTDDIIEYNRNDASFYKGIVVKNNDPNKLYRVKVYIPELTNQPLQNWLAEYKAFNMRFPGKNNVNDSWADTKMFEELSKFIPWAEPCFPLMGEGGPGRYNSPLELATISDSNYKESFSVNDSVPPTVKTGAVSPSFFFENYDTAIGDAFANPQANLGGTNNPYSFVGRPSSNVNKSKGVFNVPSVGTKVWVFHYSGDINFPVYFGIRRDFRETSLINNLDQVDCNSQSLDYPGDFENKLAN